MRNISYKDKPAKKDPSVNYQLFNNLDENNEIGEAFVWGGAGHGNNTGGNQVLYEAKANMVEYEYIRRHNLQHPPVSRVWRENSLTPAALAKYGGVCNSPETNSNKIVCFPCEGEGAIEIKAGWRDLAGTSKEDQKRYFTQEVLVYENINGEVFATNKTYGLIGLHIIRKTASYPTFIFTTFNHVDNIKTGIRYENEKGRVGKPLYYKKKNGEIVQFDTIPNTVEGGSIAILKQEDVHTIQNSLKIFNANVQAEIKTANAESVWQYYELLGVQAEPTDIKIADKDPTYYLANDVIETDYALTRFTSAFHKAGILLEQPNIFYQKPSTSGGHAVTESASVIMGGCKGCHGNAQTKGKDFSFLLSGNILAEPDTLGTANEHLMNRKAQIMTMVN